MTETPKLIEGGIYSDDRGSMAFVNDFKLQKTKRFYTITHPDTKVIRAWQGHKNEAKWFFCLKGSFQICLVKIDDWYNPSADLNVETFSLSAIKSQILQLPPGYANGFRAVEPNSQLLVFSDKALDESKNDDYRFEKSLWHNWNTI